MFIFLPTPECHVLYQYMCQLMDYFFTCIHCIMICYLHQQHMKCAGKVSVSLNHCGAKFPCNLLFWIFIQLILLPGFNSLFLQTLPLCHSVGSYQSYQPTVRCKIIALLLLLYYYMKNFCNLIGLEQWYFS